MRRTTHGKLGWLAAMGLALAVAMPAGSQSDANLLGPAARDASGRFLNTVGELERAGPSVTLPFFLRRITGVFRAAPNPPARVENDGDWLRENALHSQPTVTWVGHATLLVQMGHLSFLTDPIWSPTASPVSFLGPRRHVPPGIAIEDLPRIDFVLISHNHYDHLDLPTLKVLAKRNPNTRFYVPLKNGELLQSAGIENFQEFDWGDSIEHGGVTVLCLPVQHWSARGLGDERRALWSSWAVVSEKRRFYFAGDTGAFAGFEAIGRTHGPFDLAAVPIGAYEPVAMMQPSHMNPEEAVDAGTALQARRLVGMHFGTFDLTDEPLDEPPRRFRSAGATSGYAAEDLWVLDIGETRSF
jgi:N-acyl-phosphatidylethanolamine-hydrolysing phospholipase D